MSSALLRLPLATSLALTCAVASACGGSSDRLSKEEFQRQANAACAKYEQELNAIGKPTSPADIQGYVQKGIPIIREGLAKLRALQPPEEMQKDYDRMLTESEKSIPAARKLAEAAASGDAAAVQKALSAGQAASQASDEIATRLGLTKCVSE